MPLYLVALADRTGTLTDGSHGAGRGSSAGGSRDRSGHVVTLPCPQASTHMSGFRVYQALSKHFGLA
jgi:hypothetical protein